MYKSVHITTNCHGLRLPRMDTIYIGYDSREHDAVNVLIDSINRLSSRPLNIITLNQNALRRIGLYRRAPAVQSTCWGSEKINVMNDLFDGKPFSTEFSFSRFLVPMLNQYEGYALFIDCDMYFRSDPCELFDLCRYKNGELESKSNDIALWCVQHDYVGTEGSKMYGCPQTNYQRKNWSSLMMFNCSHKAHYNLTVDDVNTKTGNWLHRLSWLEDNMIGNLPDAWNWLDGHTSELIDAKLVHFTTGGPWFKDWIPKRHMDRVYANEWCIHARDI